MIKKCDCKNKGLDKCVNEEIEYNNVLGSINQMVDDLITKGSVIFSMRNKIDIPMARRVIINEILFNLEKTKK